MRRKVYFCRVNNIYHRDIIEIMMEGSREGCRVKNIARHIYNRHADLFAAEVNYEEIRRSVGLYLWKQSLRRESPFRHTCYGTYALKVDFALQLDLFHDYAPRCHRSEDSEEEDAAQPKEGNYPNHIQLELFG